MGTLYPTMMQDYYCCLMMGEPNFKHNNELFNCSEKSYSYKCDTV